MTANTSGSNLSIGGTDSGYLGNTQISINSSNGDLFKY